MVATAEGIPDVTAHETQRLLVHVRDQAATESGNGTFCAAFVGLRN
jgi:hypothetical protein